jgi:hypothetical protein
VTLRSPIRKYNRRIQERAFRGKHCSYWKLVHNLMKLLDSNYASNHSAGFPDGNCMLSPLFSSASFSICNHAYLAPIFNRLR